jgi:hypothetical protein
MNAAVARRTLIGQNLNPQSGDLTQRWLQTKTRTLDHLVIPIIDAAIGIISRHLGENNRLVKTFIGPQQNCKACLDVRREQEIRERAAELRKSLFSTKADGEISFCRKGPLRNFCFTSIAGEHDITIGDLSRALEAIERDGYRGWKALSSTTKGLLTFCIMAAKNNTP